MNNLIYFGGIFAIISTALLLNAKFKWLTKEDIADDVPFGLLICLVVICLGLWPITLFLAFIGFLVYLGYRYLIPDE